MALVDKALFQKLKVTAIVTLKSKTNKSLINKVHNETNFAQFDPPDGAIDKVANLLKGKGFIVGPKGRFSIVISGLLSLFHKRFSVNFAREELSIKVPPKNQQLRMRHPRLHYIVPKGKLDPKKLGAWGKHIADITMAGVSPIQCQIHVFPPHIPPPPLVPPPPPPMPYGRITPPSDISRLLNADLIHPKYTGKGVHVVMIDSGFWHVKEDTKNNFHLFYEYNLSRQVLNEIDVILAPNSAGGISWTDAQLDEGGHGTAIASGLFSIAPNITFTMIKAGAIAFNFLDLAYYSGIHLVDGFLLAQNIPNRPKPDIILFCAGAPEEWCVPGQTQGNLKQALEGAIADELNKGTVIVAASGNTQEPDGTSQNWGPIVWPATYPDVIAVGGAYPEDPTLAHSDLTWIASDAASSGTSVLHPPRKVPDVCGLCGPVVIEDLFDRFGNQIKVRYPAPYQAMPTQWGCMADDKIGQGNCSYDGWVYTTGTSCSAPMVAGVVALMLERIRKISGLILRRTSGIGLRLPQVLLKQIPLVQATYWNSASILLPRYIKEVLKRTAIDVQQGVSANNEPTGPNEDPATGAGVVNAAEACNYINYRNMRNSLTSRYINFKAFDGSAFQYGDFFT